MRGCPLRRPSPSRIRTYECTNKATTSRQNSYSDKATQPPRPLSSPHSLAPASLHCTARHCSATHTAHSPALCAALQLLLSTRTSLDGERRCCAALRLWQPRRTLSVVMTPAAEAAAIRRSTRRLTVGRAMRRLTHLCLALGLLSLLALHSLAVASPVRGTASGAAEAAQSSHGNNGNTAATAAVPPTASELQRICFQIAVQHGPTHRREAEWSQSGRAFSQFECLTLSYCLCCAADAALVSQLEQRLFNISTPMRESTIDKSAS